MCTILTDEQIDIVKKEVLKQELNEEEAKLYKNLITELKGDLKKMRGKTTEDFYEWREHLKIKNTGIMKTEGDFNMDKKVRNLLVENTIKGSALWKRIYTWTKFQRMIDAATSSLAYNSTIIREQKYLSEQRIKEAELPIAYIIHSYLKEHKLLDGNKLARAINSQGAAFNRFAKPQSPYEFVTSLYRSGQDWNIIALCKCLSAVGLNNKRLLALGRAIEEKLKSNIAALVEDNRKAMVAALSPNASAEKTSKKMVLTPQKNTK